MIRFIILFLQPDPSESSGMQLIKTIGVANFTGGVVVAILMVLPPVVVLFTEHHEVRQFQVLWTIFVQSAFTATMLRISLPLLVVGAAFILLYFIIAHSKNTRE